MKWYFALSEASISRPDHSWKDLIRVAVTSAKRNTHLQPNMLYDGEENAFTSELRNLGVNIIRHRFTLYDRMLGHRPHDSAYMPIASGAFLRLDIPIIERKSQFVLYTDCDVIFLKHPEFFGVEQPGYFGATSQTSTDPATDMNSGVMLMNIPALRTEHSALMDFISNNLELGFDQEMLRVFYDGRYNPIDRSLNWKPYWGVNPHAQIVHFHGPKPVYIKKTYSPALTRASSRLGTSLSDES